MDAMSTPTSMPPAIPPAEVDARPLRPVARWVIRRDETGRARLVMVWSVPDPDAAHRALHVVSA